MKMIDSAILRRSLVTAPVAASIALVCFLPLWRLLSRAPSPTEWIYTHDFIHGIILTTWTTATCFLFEMSIALTLAPLISVTKWRVFFILMFASPLFFGPTVCSQLWRALLAPGVGMFSQAAAVANIQVDWTRGVFWPVAVILLVQIWTLGFSASAVLASLENRESRLTRHYYRLDGFSEWRSFILSIATTRPEWLRLLVVALLVENVRAVETVHIFEMPGDSTHHLAYLAFHTGYLNSNWREEAVYALTMIVLANFAIALAFVALRKWSRPVG